MLFFGVGLADTQPKYILTVDDGVGKIHFPMIIDGFEQFTVEIVSVFMSKTDQIKWGRGDKLKLF